MAIKDIGSFRNTLTEADSKGWSKKVDSEFTKGFDVEMPRIPGENTTKTFGDFLSESLGKVNGLQQEANVAMEKLASGESQNLHETLLSVEKAEIAFKTMNQIRSKVLDAYREIMKMQI